MEKNKSGYEEYLSGAIDRAPLIVYKSSIFPTVILFVSKNDGVLLKMDIL
jgi:hypothetical protein